MSDTRERCVHGWVDPMEWCTSCMAARIAELEAQVRERDGLLRQVLDPDDCRLDHHGFCQTHGWMDRSGCPHARIRSLIGGAK